MKTGTELIAEERARQIYVEGWSDQHDDDHTRGDILLAGIAYATAAFLKTTNRWKK